jgi:hypothetical protein
MKKEFVLSPAISYLRRHLSGFDHLLLIWNAKAKSNSDPFSENQLLPTNQKVADLLNCSLRTVQRYKNKGILVSYPLGQNQSIFLLKEVMEAVNKNPRLAVLKARKNHFHPKVSVSASLSADQIFIDVNFCGWNSTIVSSRKIWRNDVKIKRLVKQVLLRQHSRKPFKINPNTLKF